MYELRLFRSWFKAGIFHMTNKVHKILIVDDNVPTLAYLKKYIEDKQKQGDSNDIQFEVITEQDGERALAVLKEELPSVVVLDIVLDGSKYDGHHLSEWVAKTPEYRSHKVGIITISSKRTRLQDESKSLLKHGAHDYLRKLEENFESKLFLRILSRIKQLEGNQILRCNKRLQIDFDAEVVIVDGQQKRLQPAEWELLKYLAAKPNQFRNTRDIEDNLNFSDIRVKISKLRAQITPSDLERDYYIDSKTGAYKLRTY